MSEITPFGYEITDLTTEWLTNWMRSKNWLTNDQSVVGFTHERLGEGYGYTTIVSGVYFQFSEGVKDDVPRSAIFKLPKIIQDVAINEFFVQFFRREYEFYEYYQKNPCPIRIPKYYYGHFLPNGNFVLILEDLRHGTGRTGDQVKGAEVFQVKEIMKQLAKLHAHWWESPLLQEFDWIKTGMSTLGFSASMFVMSWNPFVEDYKEDARGISENMLKVGDFLAKELSQYNPEKYSRPGTPKTLCHGDFRPDNMFFWDEGSEDIFCALDFQVLHSGNCAEDLAYFLGGGLTIENLLKHEEELLKIYHDHLVEFGVKDYPYEDFIGDYKENLILNVTMPIFSAHQKKMAEKSKVDDSNKPKRMDELFFSWFERSVAAIDSRIPNALEFMQSRWSHVQKVADPYEGIDGELKGVLLMIEKFAVQFTAETDVAGYQGEEVSQLKSAKEFYPLEMITSSADTTVNDLTIRVIIPHESEDIASFDSVNLYIADNRFVRGVIDSEYILYRRLANALKQPVAVISYTFAENSRFPYPVDKLTEGIRWLRSAAGIEWLSANSNSKISGDYRLNIVANVAGANMAYSIVIQNITKDANLQINKVVLLNAVLNPACDDETFVEFNELLPNWRASTWKALWGAYLPKDLSGEDASKNVEISSVNLSEDVAAKFPPTLIVYTQFDPNRKANENLIRLLRNSGASVSERYVEGGIPLVFNPNFRKGIEIFDQIKSFLN